MHIAINGDMHTLSHCVNLRLALSSTSMSSALAARQAAFLAQKLAQRSKQGGTALRRKSHHHVRALTAAPPSRGVHVTQVLFFVPDTNAACHAGFAGAP